MNLTRGSIIRRDEIPKRKRKSNDKSGRKEEELVEIPMENHSRRDYRGDYERE